MPGRSAALAVAWLALVLVFWFGLFAASMQPRLRRPLDVDVYGYFHPKFHYGNAELDAGRLPLWNPWEFAGLPFVAAAQPAALYPLKILAYDLVPGAPLHAYMVLHYLLAGVFAFVALRGLGLGTAGAALGTATWVFSGLNLDSHYHPNRLSCLTWVPLVFLGVVRVLARPGPRSAAGLALAAALLLLAGYPEYLLDTAVCLLVFAPLAGWTLARRGEGRPAAALAWLAASGVLALALAALQALPLAELVGQSARGGGGVGPGSETLDLVWRHYPTLADKVTTAVELLARTLPMAPVAWLLAVAGALVGRAPFRPAFLGMLALTTLLVTPARLVLGDLPPFHLLRPNYCWVALAYLPLAYLAGAGLDVVTRPRTLRAAPVRLALAVAIALASVPFVALRQWPLLALALGLLVAARLRPRLGSGLRLAVAGAVVLALWAWNPPAFARPALHRFAEVEVPYPPSPPEPVGLAGGVLGHCGDGPLRVLSPWRAWDGTPLVERVEVVHGYPEPLVPRRIHRLLAAAGAPPEQSLGTDLAGFGPMPRLLDVLNVGCVVAPVHASPSPDVPGLDLEVAARVGDQVYWRRPHLPRALVSHRARVVAGEDAAFGAVTAPGFDPRREVVLEAPAAPPPAADARGAARVVLFEPGFVRLAVETDAPGVLVVSQAWYPGWQATVDGRRAPVWPANFVATGVPVPAGEHEVTLAYRPWTARLGWWLLVSGLGALVACAAAPPAAGEGRA